jgi:hypothetical protein
MLKRNPRQMITISEEAYATINFDMDRIKFPKRNNKPNFSGFLNQVLENYNYTLETNPIEEIIKTIDARKNSIDGLTYKVLMSKIKTLKEKYKIRENNTLKKSTNILLNKSNYNSLYAKLSSLLEDVKWGTYLSDIFESYAKLKIPTRESIIFKQHFDILNKSIKEGKQLKIQLNNDQSYIVEPYRMNADDNNGYIIRALAINNQLNQAPYYYYSFNLTSIKFLGFTGNDFTTQRHVFDHLDSKKQESKNQIFTVHLTEEGIKQFSNQITNRPQMKKQSQEDIKNNIYRFESTFEKIFLYFVKFGSNAKIIEPKETRDMFQRFYKLAYENYNKVDENE